jgi:2,3,4,5-tetrahydropyridine-2,6-dicarboxylate N-succinyltransferase
MRSIIEAAWENRDLLKEKETIDAINHVIEDIDKGILRVAEPDINGEWIVNEWVKKAVVMYFPIRQMETIEVGPFEFHDKMALKTNYKELGVRVVPPAVARYGAFYSFRRDFNAFLCQHRSLCRFRNDG